MSKNPFYLIFFPLDSTFNMYEGFAWVLHKIKDMIISILLKSKLNSFTHMKHRMSSFLFLEN